MKKEHANFFNRILRINLTNNEIKHEKIERGLIKKFLGGRGFGSYFIMKEVSPTIDPLDSKNKLIFMNGPLSGTLIPGNNKICVTFKSPLTNTYSYSLCGGHFGPELTFAGYSGLIIEGKAENPVYLWIENEHVEIKDAMHLWGELIPKSEELLLKDLDNEDKVQTALIGPAGEKLVRYACITSGLYREFGRGGCGAVMGSKNLKGIALRGTHGIDIKNKDAMITLSKRLIANLRASSGGQIRRKYGTMELVERINGAGFWVTRNFTEGHFDEGYKLEGAEMRNKIISGDSSCFGCPIGCGKWTYMKRDEENNLYMEGPEFETVGMLGSNCGISSWNTIMEASKICDTYGFDTINAGGCIGMVMEAFEKDELTLEDTDGIEMNFGNDHALLETLKKIGERKGIGNILAKGILKASRELGIDDFAVHVKGQTFPVYDPRGAKAMALTYATSPKGAHHMYATTFGAELGMGNRFEEKGKGLLERNHQFSMAIVDSIGLCSTMRAGITLADQADAFSVVTDIKTDINDLNKAAERIINLERMFNVQIGYTRKNDTLPIRFLKSPLTKGESKGQTVDLEYLLDDYYNEMNWNSNGIPTKQKLEDLELNEIFTF